MKIGELLEKPEILVTNLDKLKIGLEESKILKHAYENGYFEHVGPGRRKRNIFKDLSLDYGVSLTTYRRNLLTAVGKLISVYLNQDVDV